MDKQWTPEPWCVGMRNGFNADTIYAYDSEDAHTDTAIAAFFGIPKHTSVDDAAKMDARWQRGIANAARAVDCVNACATIPNPGAIPEAIRVLNEEADLLLVAIGHVPGINEARKRFILAQSKALRDLGVQP